MNFCLIFQIHLFFIVILKIIMLLFSLLFFIQFIVILTIQHILIIILIILIILKIHIIRNLSINFTITIINFIIKFTNTIYKMNYYKYLNFLPIFMGLKMMMQISISIMNNFNLKNHST